jgi:ubiquinone/menaquinone biosynthesis C-methylase UbiE
LQGSSGVVLELGPGPGRFTPTLRRSTRGRVIALDLSRESLRSARRRAGRKPERSRVDWIQGAGERLPLRTRSVDVVVAFGNIVSFAALDGPALLKELARVVKPRGLLLVDFASPAAATQEFFYVAARKRLLGRVLRRPGYYLIERVLATGFQPFTPARLARWEFQFYTVAEAAKALARAAFRTIDAMSVAPIAAYQDRVAAIARREKRTWETLLRIEEQIGRRPGVLEAGHGFVVAAVRA